MPTQSVAAVARPWVRKYDRFKGSLESSLAVPKSEITTPEPKMERLLADTPKVANSVCRLLSMPIPVIPLVIGALLGNATKKKEKRQAVSKYTKTNGTKVKAYTKKAKSK
jgi:hypothetical protein